MHSGSLKEGDNAWFLEGELNASYNCVDRHAIKDPNKVAIIYEADEAGEGRNVTYGELLLEACMGIPASAQARFLGIKAGSVGVGSLPPKMAGDAPKNPVVSEAHQVDTFR